MIFGRTVMKKILLSGFVMTLLFLFSVTAEAADPAENRKLGYFDGTRTVLLLPVRYQSDDGNYAALCLYGKLEEIFRYPYYRRLDSKKYRTENIRPEKLGEIQSESGADIVVLPVVTQWSQRTIWPVAFIDPLVETRVIIDVYSVKKGEPARQDRATYFEREEEGFVRDSYIMDQVLENLWKKFPYRRVPADISADLSRTEKSDTENAVQ